MKNILGIQWGDTATVSAIKNGRVISAIAEERFTRKKNDMSFPIKSINFCKKSLNNKVDLVAIASKKFDYITTLTHFYSIPTNEMFKILDEYYYPLFYKNKKKNFLKLLKKYWKTDQYPKEYWSKVSESKIVGFSKDVKKIVSRATKVNKKNIVHVEHHKCHANYGYYTSPFKKKKCLIFTIDGAGDNGINATISVGEKGKIKKFYETKNCIVGRIYSHITLLFGMRRLEHEYKIMGLAPYAQKKIDRSTYEIFNSCLKFDGYKINFNKKPKDSFFHFEKKLRGKRFDVVAASLQQWVEDFLIEWVKNTIKIKKIKNIVFSGGVAMNAKAMGKIIELKEVKSLWVPGASQDDSICIGASLEHNKNKFVNLNSLYLGNDSDEDEKKFVKGLNNKKFIIKKYSHNLASKLLEQGKVFGRCVGKMEFGPRSLGNRSIIADPRNIETRDLINRMIKKRDFWMPFAPTVLDKVASKYLINSNKIHSHHMSVTYKTTKLGNKNLKAASHDADNTVRAQILTRKINKEYYDLISSFYKLTGCGGLLNTSFNLHGFPVVKSLKDSLFVLNNSGLDGIISRNYIVLKK